jgi:hypothetical protein
MNDNTFFKWMTIALACVLAIFCSIYLSKNAEAEKHIAAAETWAKAQDLRIAEKDKLIKDVQARIDERDHRFADRERELIRERDAIKDTKTAHKAIRAAVPGAAMVSVTRDQLTPEMAKGLPDAPHYTVMTEQTAVDLGRMTVDLKRATEKVTKLTADFSDVSIQLRAAQDAKALAESKAAQWETAARGGTVAHRMKSAGKWMAVGAVVGVVAYRVGIRK